MRIEAGPVAIDADEVEVSFIASSGPGGQNVNKVATAAQLRFDARGSLSLPNAVKARLQALAGSRLTNDGVIVITARRFRTQERNRADALKRLLELIREAAVPPGVRRPTRVPFGQRQDRLQAKTVRSGVKRARGRPEVE